jgi:hypothetical protein
MNMSGDMRKYARQTNFRLWIGFFILLFLVGGGLIYWFYGSRAALLGVVCLVVGLLPLLLIWLILAGLEWVAKRGE